MRAVQLIAGLACALTAVAAEGVQGRVLEDQNGSPVTSAAVRLFHVGDGKPAAELATDGEGLFRALALTAGEYRLEIAKDGYVNTTVFAAITAAGTALPIRLVRYGTISGMVMDRDRQPARGARVFALAKTEAGFLPPRSTVTTNDRGEYRLFNLPPGQYEVGASYNNGSTLYPPGGRPQSFTISGGEQSHADFNLDSGSFFSAIGRVLLPAPRTRMAATFDPVDHPEVSATTSSPDDYGRLQFPRIPSGSYNLLISGPPVGRGASGAVMEDDERYYSRIRVDVSGENVTGLQIEVQRGRTARFVLRAAEGCTGSAQLTMLPMEDWGANVERIFEIHSGEPVAAEDLAPTRFRLLLSGTGACYQGETGLLDLIKAAPEEPVVVPVVRPGSLRGKLTGAAEAGDCAVVLLSGNAVRVVLAGVDGQFRFDGLAPGHYRLAAQAAGARWVNDIERMFDIEVSGGAATELDLPAPKRQ